MLPYQNLSLEDMPGEVWMDFPGYEGKYMASDMGRIKRLPSFQNGIHFREKILIQTLSGGYLRVAINQHQELVSRVVAKTFLPNAENRPTVDHINGNPLDNRLCNLRWATYEENANNPVSHERLVRWARNGGVYSGAQHYKSKSVVCINIETGEIRSFVSLTEAESVGASSRTIRRYAYKETKLPSFRGWKFFFADDPELKSYLPKQSASLSLSSPQETE